MPMNREQLAMIHILAAQAGIDTRKDRTDYELLLRNVGGVASSKDLTQEGFEDVMATLEDLAEGRGENPQASYWRDKVASRGTRANARMRWKISELHEQYEQSRGETDAHYELAGLVARASKQRTRELAQLSPREAWNLIEQLKKMIDRLAAGTAPVAAGDAPF